MKPISAYFGSDRPKRTKKEPAKESEPKEEKPKRGKRKAEVHDQVCLCTHEHSMPTISMLTERRS